MAAPEEPASALQINEAESNGREGAGRLVSVVEDPISRLLLSSYCGLSTVRKGTVPVLRELPVCWRRGVCESCRRGELRGLWPQRGTAPAFGRDAVWSYSTEFKLESLHIPSSQPEGRERMGNWLGLCSTHSCR